MCKIILILLAMSSTVFSGEPDEKFHTKCLYPTIMILNSSNRGSGSGVIVKSVKKNGKFENYALTCAHVVKRQEEEKETISAITDIANLDYILARIGVYEDWSTLVGIRHEISRVIAIDESKDIAIISFSTNIPLFVADIDKNPKLYIGNEISKIGCGVEESFRLDFGRITSVRNSTGTLMKDTYRISAPTIHGDSGGPVFHNEKIIGITEAVNSLSIGGPFRTPLTHMAYVIPIGRFFEDKIMAEYLNDK